VASNARRGEQLMAKTAQKIIQSPSPNLSVLPVLDDNGIKTGKFEIPAGGRRLRLCRCC